MNRTPESPLGIPRLRDALFALAGVVAFLVLAGVLGYGNFAASPLGFVLLVTAGFLGIRLGHALA